jgi:hypothetical protein
MSLIPFHDLPDTARLWIFAADRTLEPGERRLAEESVLRGLAAWNAHGSPVTWGYETRYDRFLLVAADETHTTLSGCSIDHAVHQIQAVERRLGLSFLDRSRIVFRDGDTLRTESRPAFRDRVQAGTVTGDTIVFNNTVATVGDLRQGRWEVPLSRSWHAQAFPVRVP